ncbi:MAG: 30S ribosomal protein S17 [Nitrosomonas sp.]|nr:30S ribosomal protein S17 [Nitrosomonas sp.]
MKSDKLNRTISGKVISNKMDKTVTVLVERRLMHPLYGKFITRSKKYHAHDEVNQYSVGDIVLLEECRPLSKTKNWKVIEKV